MERGKWNESLAEHQLVWPWKYLLQDQPINHKRVSYSLPWHVYINPSALYYIKVHFSVKCIFPSNSGMRRLGHSGAEKRGNKNYAAQEHLSPLSDPMRANSNWSWCSSSTQKIHPLINTLLRKSRCGSSSRFSFYLWKWGNNLFLIQKKRRRRAPHNGVPQHDLWRRISVYFFSNNKKIQQ